MEILIIALDIRRQRDDIKKSKDDDTKSDKL